MIKDRAQQTSSSLSIAAERRRALEERAEGRATASEGINNRMSHQILLWSRAIYLRVYFSNFWD